eukprot:53551_1
MTLEIDYPIKRKTLWKMMLTKKKLKQISEDSLFERYLMCDEIKIIQRIMSHKSDLLELQKNQSNLRYGNDNRYNQLCMNVQVSDESMSVKYYSLGHEFVYGYVGEQKGWGVERSQDFTAKYTCLKEELISNNIAQLTVHQFNSEYKKCNTHFLSVYCRRKFPKPKTLAPHQFGIVPDFTLKLEYLLSLMIYCNYSSLQYEFSKTYRWHLFEKHNEFYHMGKYLKILVHQFGTSIKDGEIKEFFHGINEKLRFTHYIQSPNGNRGLKICCPLSTSSSREVAINFTNNQQGLLLKFGGSSCRYFSAAWVSDFGNEKEYLFIQNQNELLFVNIIEVSVGYDLSLVLTALNLIHDVTSDAGECSWPINLTDAQIALAKAIINGQLSYKHFELKGYAKQLVSVYFNNRMQLTFDHMNLIASPDYEQYFDMFWYSHCKFIKLKEIKILFPNVKNIYIYGIYLCSEMIDDILFNLELANMKIQWIKTCKCSNPSFQQTVVDRYNNKFAKTGYIPICNQCSLDLTLCFENSIHY